MKTYSYDVPCCVLAVGLIVLLWRVCLLQSLQFQLWRQEGAEVWDGAWPGCDHWRQSHTINTVTYTHHFEYITTSSVEITHMGRQWCRLWRGSESLRSWPWSAWGLAPHLSSESLPSLSLLGSLTQALWTSAGRNTLHWVTLQLLQLYQRENNFNFKGSLYKEAGTFRLTGVLM